MDVIFRPHTGPPVEEVAVYDERRSADGRRERHAGHRRMRRAVQGVRGISADA